MRRDLVSASKFLSLVLRHAPDKVGVELDANGWADVADLLAGACAAGRPITPELLDEVVFTNDKQRFAFSDDGLRIRASQGHSVAVDLELLPVQPPERLFHGTATRFLDAIRAGGLRPMSRRHVHLAANAEQAHRVGARHGRPVVLVVDCVAMVGAAHEFYRSANGVWLTEHVPPEYLSE